MRCVAYHHLHQISLAPINPTEGMELSSLFLGRFPLKEYEPEEPFKKQQQETNGFDHRITSTERQKITQGVGDSNNDVGSVTSSLTRSLTG